MTHKNKFNSQHTKESGVHPIPYGHQQQRTGTQTLVKGMEYLYFLVTVSFADFKDLITFLTNFFFIHGYSFLVAFQSSPKVAFLGLLGMSGCSLAKTSSQYLLSSESPGPARHQHQQSMQTRKYKTS